MTWGETEYTQATGNHTTRKQRRCFALKSIESLGRVSVAPRGGVGCSDVLCARLDTNSPITGSPVAMHDCHNKHMILEFCVKYGIGKHTRKATANRHPSLPAALRNTTPLAQILEEPPGESGNSFFD
jgi:hypothetical protein